MNEKIDKMLKRLEKMITAGQGGNLATRLRTELLKINRSKNLLTDEMVLMLTARQSMEGCLMAAIKVSDMLTTVKLQRREIAAVKRAEKTAGLPVRKVVRGYYTDDLTQRWVSEKDEDFSLSEYEAYKSACYRVRRGY